MTHQLTFQQLTHYSTSKDGISLGVQLASGNATTVCEAKLDTGASGCIFERALAENLGLELETGLPQMFGTVTGSFLAYGHEVRLRVMDIELDTFVYFAAEANFTRNVLGRRGWLDRVRLALVDYEGTLYLSTYGEA